MSRSGKSALSVLVLLLVPLAGLAREPRLSQDPGDVIHGGNAASAGAARDTIRLIGPWGSGALANGQFQNAQGGPAWNGWTHVDLTGPSESAWHADTYRAVQGQYSAWCGDIRYPACAEDDTIGGYGPYYDDLLGWSAAVADPSQATTVTVTALVSHDTEPGYDFSNLGYFKAGEDIRHVWTTDGFGEHVTVSASFQYQPGEYVGDGDDEIHIAWHVQSDYMWDDGDCSFYGAGALQVDNIEITVDNAGQVTYFTDFEDGTLGDWVPEMPTGVGDYAHIRADHPGDADRCFDNWSPVVCFIADDIMERERDLPSQLCELWCYGPDGYIVNTHGGLKGPDWGIHNVIRSPVVAWPGGDYNDAAFEFDVFRHEDLTSDAPGIFYTWAVRSTASPDPEDIEIAPFENRSYYYYGSPQWLRGGDLSIGDLLVVDAQWVQVELGVEEPMWLSGWNNWDGSDGYPAPYFDNVSLKASPRTGPLLTASLRNLAQDAFPADGHLYWDTDLGLNDVRFDMAMSISYAADLRNDPGDSIVVRIARASSDALIVLSESGGTATRPRLYFAIAANPVFDASLRLPVGTFTATAGAHTMYGEITSYANDVIEGWVGGDLVYNPTAYNDAYWMFDLPDEDLLYPGDVLHYYVEAWQERDGGFESATLPADLGGFGDFSESANSPLPERYDHRFVVRALPSLRADGSAPDILVWDDADEPEIRNEWFGALLAFDWYAGRSYDIYRTSEAATGLGNGLGGRATLEQIEPYRIILYTSGGRTSNTITPVVYGLDPGDDLGLLNAFLDLDGRSLVACGDNLASDLTTAGAEGMAFLNDRMGLGWIYYDLQAVLGGDMNPTVHPSAEFFGDLDDWFVYGGCAPIRTLDAVAPLTAEVVAGFNDGASGTAAVSHHAFGNSNHVIMLPYDLSRVRDLADPTPDGFILPARFAILRAAISACGYALTPEWGTGVEPPAARFSVRAGPNPFNPTTRIEFNLPAADQIAVEVFDLHGRRVRSLLDEARPAGPGHVVWDGSDDRGGDVASGIYFYRVRAGEHEHIGKIALVK